MPHIHISSPVGSLLLEHDGAALTSLRFGRDGEREPESTREQAAREDALGRRLAEQLAEYFAGVRRDFDLPLRPSGSEYQRRVWAALLEVPYGETRTYRELATAIGSAGGARAIGQANARNPIPIVIPCHRVVATGGAIGGYAGDWGEGAGIVRKRWLLSHEGADMTERGSRRRASPRAG